MFTEQILPDLYQQRLARSDRQRARGAGRPCDQPVVIRVAAVLTYLRLYAPQFPVALMYGMTQPNLSRDLRRIVPALHCALPCPEVRAFRTMCPSGNSTTIPTGWSISSMASFATCCPSSRQRTVASNPFYPLLICSAHMSWRGSRVSPAFSHVVLCYRDEQHRVSAVSLSWCATQIDACWLRLACRVLPPRCRHSVLEIKLPKTLRDDRGLNAGLKRDHCAGCYLWQDQQK